MRNKILVLLVVLTFFIQFLTMNVSPNSWDSAEYSYYVKDVLSGDLNPISGSFISNKPLYIMTAAIVFNIFNLLFSGISYLFSLNFVSVLLGSLSLIPFFYIAKSVLKSRFYAYVSVVLFMFNPLFWWGSSEAMSEVPSLFFLLMSVYFFYKWVKTDLYRFLSLSFLVLGIGLLYRFALVIYLPMLSLLAIYLFLKRRDFSNIHKLFFSGLSFVIPLIFFIFLMNYITGIDGFLRYFSRSIYSSSIFTFGNVFNLKVWVGHIYYLINGVTLPLFVMAMMGFILFLYRLVKYRLDDIHFLLLSMWLFISLIFSAGLPVVLSRYEVFVAPVFILLFVYFIKSFKFNRLWDVIILFLCSGFLLLNYLDMYKVYYVSAFDALFDVFSNVGVYYFISVLLLFFILVLSLKFKHSSVLTIVVLILVTSVLHAMPILYLFGESSYVDNIGGFYSDNMGEGDLIIAGYDKPYDILYTSADVVFYRDEGEGTVNSKEKIYGLIDDKLESGGGVYFSNEHFLVNLYSDLDMKYDVNMVGSVSGRGIHDWGSVFMNYWSYKYSEEVYIYSLNFKS